MTTDAALEMPLEQMPQERDTPSGSSLDFDVGLIEDSSAYTISLPTEEPDTEGLLDGFTGGQVRYLDDFDVGEVDEIPAAAEEESGAETSAAGDSASGFEVEHDEVTELASTPATSQPVASDEPPTI